MANMAGKLYYVIGPSGSGKDTLIDAVRVQYPDDLIVAHRYITRSADSGGENHVALTVEEFGSRRDKGLFALYWQAHGLEYGIGQEVMEWLAKGFSVVVNGSRAELSQARRCFGAQLIPVVIQVEQGVLRQRLVDRARETEQDIERRLARAAQYTLPQTQELCVIDNSGNIEHSVQQFSLLRAEFESGETA
ncbi:ribose 1,5-bisphosphokinase [Vibrio hippocampi]|uniref:Ribose 1,5-bisphosphate phosphokinase PhnN n=1 Tax=Vibrio hippocampi TaxID=654686 RepID=A0ABM8ZNP1_9VIBR|nr:ribose 1,5-bisphosphokinase [Vibrio hippocampi]CAH0530285.1 Ribose 1,5-bisphosphate phosphokinase PhnN [Vibrio hippocampi]